MNEVIAVQNDSGGLLLLDPGSAGSLGDDFADLLAIVLDPEGRTAQGTEDDEPWAATWQRAARPLDQMQGEGRFQLILTGEGVFHVQITDSSDRIGAKVRGTWLCGRLVAGTGGLIITDMWPNPENRHELALPPNEYWLWVHCLEVPSHVPRTVGVLGALEWPALALELSVYLPSENVQPVPFPCRLAFPESAWQPEPGCLCEATVKRSEGDVLLLNLHKTRRLKSGYARMPTPSFDPPRLGQSIVVRIMSRASGYWNAEWIRDR